MNLYLARSSVFLSVTCGFNLLNSLKSIASISLLSYFSAFSSNLLSLVINPPVLYILFRYSYFIFLIMSYDYPLEILFSHENFFLQHFFNFLVDSIFFVTFIHGHTFCSIAVLEQYQICLYLQLFNKKYLCLRQQPGGKVASNFKFCMYFQNRLPLICRSSFSLVVCLPVLQELLLG